MKKEKHHFRKVFKSDHLGIADIEEMAEQGKSLVMEIKQVKQEIGVKVAGRKIDANIAYFTDPTIKPLVLNATNSKQVKKFAGGSPFVEDWNNIVIEVFADLSVQMKGETVGGVRIKPIQPRINKPQLTPAHKKWGAAREAVETGGATLESIRKGWDITAEN